jgi:dCTP deaminase
MGWLTGKEIARQVAAGRIRIDPYDAGQCNPNSYDYRLGNVLRVMRPNAEHNGVPCIDPRKEMACEEVTIPEEGFLLEPGKAYLGSTLEKFGSDHYASLITGKSSIGRLFIKNHICAGLIDQGFYNHITLEITCQLPVLVFPGMRFGQIFWFESIGECELYRGKYQQGSNAARPSRVHLDWRR